MYSSYATDKQTDKQTDRQTDTQDYKVSEQKQTLPHICVGREQNIYTMYVNIRYKQQTVTNDVTHNIEACE